MLFAATPHRVTIHRVTPHHVTHHRVTGHLVKLDARLRPPRDELGEREEFDLLLQKKRLAAKIERAMAVRNMSEAGLARAMNTSCTVVRRLLDPNDTSVTLSMVSKTSKALGV